MVRLKHAAFSLVEVTIAIGIVAFAFLGLLGMIPTGLNTFRRAMDASMGAQLTQRIIDESMQTDFNTLVAAGNLNTVRYFDEQGNELTTTKGALYQVHVLVTAATTMPATGTPNPNLATIVIQVANNPSGRTIALDKTNTTLWNDPTIPISTYSGMVGTSPTPK